MADNPFAFPRPAAWVSENDRDHGEQDGMSLRDYFAGQALIGVMAMRAAIPFEKQFSDDVNQESIAEEAYELADAMLAAREEKEPSDA